MEKVILNETPRRTSKSFGINNIQLKELEIPKIKKFSNVNINSTIPVQSNVPVFKPGFGIGDVFIEQLNNANQNLYMSIDTECNEPIIIEFVLDEMQDVLVDNVFIDAKENSSASIVLKYITNSDEVHAYHNGVCRVNSEKNANIQVTILNLLNNNSTEIYSMNNVVLENANLEYIIAEFGGGTVITNYYSSLVGNISNNTVNTMYLGTNDQLLDFNYLADVYGKKANIDMEVYGALKDNARKNFKGTIDFKTGCKKATGNENEYCMLLSKTAKSKALPMLLCSEEEVQGNHSNSAGKIDEDKLYYIMARGISKKDAQKLIVKAKFNNVLEKIQDEDLKAELIKKIDNRLA